MSFKTDSQYTPIFVVGDLSVGFRWGENNFKKFVPVAENKYRAADTHSCPINLFLFIGKDRMEESKRCIMH
jgi:hypothetical protein